ncbi:MAG: hypothetical protein IJ968_09685 [Clostridia bacterium]|nr:hypothetical protein [Clostridia bacterium]
MRISLKRTCCMLLCIVLWGNALFACADQYLDSERYFAGKESVSGYIQVPGVDEPMRYYAQNDTLWGELIYEKKGVEKARPFHDSGCGPSALAIAIKKLVSNDDLPLISSYASSPYSLCECAINKGLCSRHKGRYVITSQRDYERFLPLIMADFACGNNTFGVYSRSAAQGTSVGYIPKVCQVYGLEYSITQSFDEAMAALGNKNQAVIALAGSGGCFTNTGHYVFMAHADEEKLYILDPLCRTVYKTNNAAKLTILQPGLVTLDYKDVWSARFSNYIIITDYSAKKAE